MEVETWARPTERAASSDSVSEAHTTGRAAGQARVAALGSSPRTRLRRALYRAWPRVPRWCRRLVLRLALPRHPLGVCAVALDARGRVLVAHHTYRTSAWGLPGGFVRRREQPPRALARELCEELGADAAIGPLLHAELHEPTGHLTLYYRATLLETPRPDGVELDDLRFVSGEQALALLGPEAVPWLASLSALRAS
jgi:8-oxo-dGTP diphosphatase